MPSRSPLRHAPGLQSEPVAHLLGVLGDHLLVGAGGPEQPERLRLVPVAVGLYEAGGCGDAEQPRVPADRVELGDRVPVAAAACVASGHSG